MPTHDMTRLLRTLFMIALAIQKPVPETSCFHGDDSRFRHASFPSAVRPSRLLSRGVERSGDSCAGGTAWISAAWASSPGLGWFRKHQLCNIPEVPSQQLSGRNDHRQMPGCSASGISFFKRTSGVYFRRRISTTSALPAFPWWIGCRGSIFNIENTLLFLLQRDRVSASFI